MENLRYTLILFKPHSKHLVDSSAVLRISVKSISGRIPKIICQLSVYREVFGTEKISIKVKKDVKHGLMYAKNIPKVYICYQLQNIYPSI